ncbi:MAG: AAA family ATPase [Candidatus Freyarchaeota archaeon]
MEVENLKEVYESVKKRVVGREREIRNILAALVAGRHILLEGPPGTSKSTLLQAIAEEIGVPFIMVEGNADLTASKLLGYFDPAQAVAEGYKPEHFVEGPLLEAMRKGGILYIDEFNRIPPDALNVLMRAIEEGEIVVPRVGPVRSRNGFRLVSAQNPYDDVGTTKVSMGIYDRLCKLRMNYQSREEEKQIVRLRTGCKDERLVELAVNIVRRTRSHPEIRQGASVRGAMLSGKLWLVETSQKTPEQVIRQIVLESLGMVSGEEEVRVRPFRMTEASREVREELRRFFRGSSGRGDPPRG